MINQTPNASKTDPRMRASAILHQVARGRSQVYRWLALGFYPPDAKLVSALNTGQLAEEILIGTVWLGNDRKKFLASSRRLRACATVNLIDLDSDYTRLFGKSIERVPMRESAYRWREASALVETANDVTYSLHQTYGQFGVIPVENYEDLLPVEFEFMAYLCEREAAQWQANVSLSARQLRLQERTFLDDHLGRWFPEFCRRVFDQLPDHFYEAMISLGDTWLNLEYGPGYIPARSLE